MKDLLRIPLDPITTPPQPPAHLADRGREFWQAAVSCRQFETLDLAVLQAAAEMLDRAQLCRDQVTRDGAFIAGRNNTIVTHPAVLQERQSVLAFEKLRRSLNLDAVPAALPKIKRAAYK